MTSVPRGWTEATLGDLCQPVGTVRPDRNPNEVIRYIDIGSIDSTRHTIGDVAVLSGADAPSRARQLVRAGDTLLSTVRTYLKRTALVPPELDSAVASTGFCVLRAASGVEAKFLLYRVIEDRFVAELSALQTGSSYPAVRNGDVFSRIIAVPPPAEQRRIVAAIDESLSRLDEAERLLRHVKQGVERMRLSVLASAVQGSWPRRKIGDIGNGSRNDLAIGPFGSNLKVSDYRAEGTPLVFVRNIRAARFSGADTKYISEDKARELAAHVVRPGDVLVTKMGDPPGDACVYPSNMPNGIITADCIKISAHDRLFDPRFVTIAIIAPEGRRAVLEVTSGVAQKKVSLARFRTIEIPVPPLREQHRIVAEVDHQLSLLDFLSTAIQTALVHSVRLRRAVLEYAFSGRLVPQDPTDETETEALAPFAAERATTTKLPRRKQA